MHRLTQRRVVRSPAWSALTAALTPAHLEAAPAAWSRDPARRGGKAALRNNERRAGSERGPGAEAGEEGRVRSPLAARVCVDAWLEPSVPTGDIPEGKRSSRVRKEQEHITGKGGANIKRDRAACAAFGVLCLLGRGGKKVTSMCAHDVAMMSKESLPVRDVVVVGGGLSLHQESRRSGSWLVKAPLP